MSKRAIPLNIGNPIELVKIKEQIDIIYDGLRALNVLIPHSVYMPKDDILAALGIVREGDHLIEDPNLDGAERAGLLFYLMPTEELRPLSAADLKQELFPATAPENMDDISRITIAIVTANETLESFQQQGAYLATSECPPRNDCPPWHTPPPVN